MSFPSGLGSRLFALAATILLIGSTEASARPRHSHQAAAAQASACFGFFCVEKSPAQVRAEARQARRHAAEQAAQTALQQRAALRQQAMEARLAARHHLKPQAVGTESSFSAPATSGQHVAATIVGGRPAGCPFKFCACGASIEVFGRIIPRLNLAANWFRDFPHVPHASAASGMVAGNSRHVFVLKQHVRGDVWLVKNYNSRGHRTRLYEKRLAGFTVVDPRGGRLASSAY